MSDQCDIIESAPELFVHLNCEQRDEVLGELFSKSAEVTGREEPLQAS